MIVTAYIILFLFYLVTVEWLIKGFIVRVFTAR